MSFNLLCFFSVQLHITPSTESMPTLGILPKEQPLFFSSPCFADAIASDDEGRWPVPAITDYAGPAGAPCEKPHRLK